MRSMIMSQMMRVISSPFISTTGVFTLILLIVVNLLPWAGLLIDGRFIFLLVFFIFLVLVFVLAVIVAEIGRRQCLAGDFLVSQDHRHCFALAFQPVVRALHGFLQRGGRKAAG